MVKALNINKSTLRGWLNGGQPKQSALPALRRIESFFAIEPNTLVALAYERNYYKPADEENAKKIAYRVRLAAVSKDPYRLKSISEQLAHEWRGLVVHKTEKLPLLKRYSKGSWVTTEYITKGKTELNQHLFFKDKYVPTSKIVWGSVISYLGWMCRDMDSDGAGLSIEDVQTIAWLTHKPMIHRYLGWKIERAEGKVHNGILDFVQQVKALTHPIHGYLTQMPSLNAHLPEQYRHANWLEACHEAFDWSSDMNRNLIAGGIEQSRKPMEPIMHVLELPSPLEAIGDMTDRMRASKPVTGGVEEAIWARDLQGCSCPYELGIFVCSHLRVTP